MIWCLLSCALIYPKWLAYINDFLRESYINVK